MLGMLTVQCSSVYGPLYSTLEHAGTVAGVVAAGKLNREVERLFTAYERDRPILVDTLQGMLSAEPESLVPDAALPLCKLPACRDFIIRLLLRFYKDTCEPYYGAGTPGDVPPVVRSALSVCAGAFASTFTACSPTLTHTASAKRTRSARSSEGSGQPQPADEH